MKKRYSDFLTLYEKVLRRYSIPSLLDGSYKFPNKSMFNTGATYTKERRKKGFDELLKLLVDHTEFCEELLEFLDLNYQFDDTSQPDEVAVPSPPSQVPMSKDQQRSVAAELPQRSPHTSPKKNEKKIIAPSPSTPVPSSPVKATVPSPKKSDSSVNINAVNAFEAEEEEAEDSSWPFFSFGKVQNAVIVALVIYGGLISCGAVSVGRTTLPRMLLTVALLALSVLLAHRVSRKIASS